MKISASNYLLYFSVDNVISVNKMDSAIDEYINTYLDYTKNSDTESLQPPKYFIINSKGELYYQTRWSEFIDSLEYGEMLVLKAPK